jgi:DNA-binding response OmpR family regulator
MPIKDGLTMLGEMRETVWGKEIPVILLTNLSDNEKVAAALAKGSHDYLVKSNWKLEDVVTRIRERLI